VFTQIVLLSDNKEYLKQAMTGWLGAAKACSSAG
jgi:hypothetical protein